MRELVERGLGEHGVLGERGRARRSVTVNLRESPLSWLAARGLVTARQLAAGERLRADWERAQLSPRVTMAWDRVRVDGGSADSGDATTAQLSAKRRFDAAVAAAGPGLQDVLWRVVCAGEGLPATEKAFGWPVRAGRVVLCLALDRVAAWYGV
ncbi:DUF6456 domain-containing protein [Sphingomonas sp.]|uniref:DUF6456 domain-containing protein n=1 Tax=Sphingomonas sp. TaxID=28214 RepID=UPI003CC609A7